MAVGGRWSKCSSFKNELPPLFKIAFDVADGNVSKAVVGSKWEEKQQ